MEFGQSTSFRSALSGSTLPDSTSVIERDATSGRYAARVDISSPSTLLFKTSFHPGWRATVEGEQIEPLMLAPSYVGVLLPAGQSDVLIEYAAGRSRGLLMLAGVVVLALIASQRTWVRRLPQRLRI